jgi:hypothetical protein
VEEFGMTGSAYGKGEKKEKKKKNVFTEEILNNIRAWPKKSLCLLPLQME